MLAAEAFPSQEPKNFATSCSTIKLLGNETKFTLERLEFVRHRNSGIKLSLDIVFTIHITDSSYTLKIQSIINIS